ncbi:MAG: hypothetical protein NC037_01060 [Bacteroides sp.]|nr:hypothetical protein [Bacillota bacterium]MCM1393512.1 hypothetical protein [[Eubacterium] siraeum]MCM1455105.1 hypothetical protein [Bacteroides sp.]
MFPKRAIRWCLSVLVIGVFFFSLFAFVGMPIYAAATGISYAQAWQTLWQAICAAAN